MRQRGVFQSRPNPTQTVFAPHSSARHSDACECGIDVNDRHFPRDLRVNPASDLATTRRWREKR